MAAKLKLHNVWFSYGGEAQPVLRNVNLEVQEREVFCILGQCGCGKTTLAKLLVGLLAPSHGSIEINGQNINSLSKESLLKLRHDIGFLFQNSALVSNMTVHDNIALPLRYHLNFKASEIDDQVDEMITRSGLSAYQDRLPAQLSIGQRKRAAIVRALAMNPRLMVYDEPTAGLDPINSLGIADIIRDRYEENRTTSVIITHDIPFAFSIATKAAVMYRGKVIFYGNADELPTYDDPYIREFLGNYAKTRKTA